MSSPYVTSDSLITVDIFIDIAKPGFPRVLADHEVAKLDKDKLPDNIKKETSHWRRPSWSLSTMITANSYVEDREGRQRFDMTKFAISRIRALLVDWSLKDGDPALALEKHVRPDMPGVSVLSDAAIRVLGAVDTSIVEAFYAGAMSQIYPDISMLGGVAPEAVEGN